MYFLYIFFSEQWELEQEITKYIKAKGKEIDEQFGNGKICCFISLIFKKNQVNVLFCT